MSKLLGRFENNNKSLLILGIISFILLVFIMSIYARILAIICISISIMYVVYMLTKIALRFMSDYRNRWRKIV